MQKPVRLQLKRIKGFNLKKLSKETNGLEYAVVSRPSKWGNPYIVGKLSINHTFPVSAEQAVAFFRDFVYGNPRNIAIIAKELKGKNLACWCPLNQKCHADILLKIANEKVETQRT